MPLFPNKLEQKFICNSIDHQHGKNTWRITNKTNDVLQISNPGEAGTRLTFQVRMNNEVAFILIKDADVFLLLIYALGQLECFLPPWFMKIDSNQLININVNYYYKLVSDISDFLSQ